MAFGDAMSDIRKALDEKPPAETALLIEVEQQRISAIPGGEPIQGKGLTPDQEVEEPSVDFGESAPETDAILDAAIARVRARKAA